MDNIKKFEDFLGRMQGLLDNAKKQGHIIVRVEDLENAFPELKESEDEKIREYLIRYIDNTMKSSELKSKLLAWLEKQGEQKLADKVIKTKFHEGEWVVFNNRHDSVYQVEKIENYEYTLRHFLGGSMPLSFSHEDMIRAWTVKDAKPGDVLATCAGAFIYNGNNGGGSCPGSYCGINTLGRFKTGVETHWTGKKVYPATKEQRDLLFQKMKEAGYEWDAEKKELKKIENRPMLSDFFNAEYERGKADALKSVNWSNEDEGFLNLLLSIFTNEHPNGVFSTGDITPFNGICVTSNRIIDWLKSLKYKVCPKQKWSEEDKNVLEDIRKAIVHYWGLSKQDNLLYWLKSLEESITWTPSDKQMKALDSVIDEYDGYPEFDSLVSLKNDLRKL